MKPGDLITFGRYPQTAAGTDRTPISWRVLARTPTALFVLSEYILDCKRYHRTAEDTSWRDCDLRRWLNRDFVAAAFTPREQQRIKSARCTHNGDGRPDTRDRVFLLSAAEVKAFTDPGDGAHRRRTTATAFAKVRKPDGCWLYVYDKGVQHDYVGTRGCSWWWLRSQEQTGRWSRASFVGARSNLKTYGQVDQPRCGVRPALKLAVRGTVRG